MKSKNKRQKTRMFIISAISMLSIDLLTKQWAEGLLGKQIILIDPFLSLHYQVNKGVAFGIEFGHILQILVSIIIIALLLYWGFKWLMAEKRNPFLNSLLLGIIIGGALGNLFNRIQLGHVVDFINLRPIPVFNLADVAITLGLITLFILARPK